ncbi:MAG: hypothetical protein ACI35O_11380 [Bacillaceae bacterium]
MITTGNNNFFFSHKYDKETIQNICLTQACFFTVFKNFNQIKEDGKNEFFNFTTIKIKNENIVCHKKQISTYHFENNTGMIPFFEQILFYTDDLNFYSFLKTSRIGRSDILLNKHTITYEYEFEFGVVAIHIEFEQHREENEEIIMENPKCITIEAIPISSNGIIIFNEPVGNRFYQDLTALNSPTLPINVFGQQMIKI